MPEIRKIVSSIQLNFSKQQMCDVEYHTGVDAGGWDPFEAFLTGVFKDETDEGFVEVIPSNYDPNKNIHVRYVHFTRHIAGNVNSQSF